MGVYTFDSVLGFFFVCLLRHLSLCSCFFFFFLLVIDFISVIEEKHGEKKVTVEA